MYGIDRIFWFNPFLSFYIFALELDNYVYQLKNYHFNIYRYFVQMFKDFH